ncbi:MAG: hypothetical protein AABX01_02070 [Candidatus Micrarchaeota archaeon]
MKTNMKFAGFAMLFLLLIAAFSNAATKNVDDEARKYVLRGESAEYFILNTSEGKVFYVVLIDGKSSLVFNDKVDPVTDEATLVSVLRDYYLQSGATGFTEATKADLLRNYNESKVLFDKCHFYFYDLVETNFFWAQFRCVDASTGRVCDAVFAQRKRMKESWDVYDEKIQLLKTAASREQIGDALSQINIAGTKAKNETVYFDDAGVGYAYFLGKTMEKDPFCAFKYGYVDEVIRLSGEAYRDKITDINTEALDIIRIYNSRKDVLKIKELQVQGREVLEKAINKTSVVPVKFAPIDAKYKEIEAAYEKLKNSSTFEGASNNFNTMNTRYGELAAIIDDPNGLLFSYNKTVSAEKYAKAAIDAAALKYTANDTRVIDLTNEHKSVRSEMDDVNKRLSNNSVVTVAELAKLEAKFIDIGRRALGLPSRQNELDLTTTVAIVVVLATLIGVVIYIVKFRKKGGSGGIHNKEMDIRTVMGSGEKKQPLAREEVDREQHRKAMFPKL